MDRLAARVGKPHGLRGEVTVQVHTDAPEQRFTPGARFATEPDRGPLTLRSARQHQRIWLLGFEEAGDRTAAEALRGTRLLLAADELPDADDGGEGWYPAELVGAQVRDPSGAVIGEVTDLLTRPAQDLLQVRLTDGRTGLVPFVEALVPAVRVSEDERYVVVDAPDGLFDL